MLNRTFLTELTCSGQSSLDMSGKRGKKSESEVNEKEKFFKVV